MLSTKKKMTMKKTTNIATMPNNYNILDWEATNDLGPTSITSLFVHLPSNYSDPTNTKVDLVSHAIGIQCQDSIVNNEHAALAPEPMTP